MGPEFAFSVTKNQDSLFVQATGQEKFQIFAETKTKFFTKVDDAKFEFVADESGKAIKVIMSQGGREAEAVKVK